MAKPGWRPRRPSMQQPSQSQRAASMAVCPSTPRPAQLESSSCHARPGPLLPMAHLLSLPARSPICCDVTRCQSGSQRAARAPAQACSPRWAGGGMNFLLTLPLCVVFMRERLHRLRLCSQLSICGPTPAPQQPAGHVLLPPLLQGGN